MDPEHDASPVVEDCESDGRRRPRASWQHGSHLLIDIHGHHTTYPPGVEAYCGAQIGQVGEPAKGKMNVSDDEIRPSIETGQVKVQRGRGTDLTLFSPRASDLNFLGIGRRQVEWWSMRLAPLGMTPAQFHEFRATLLSALREEGIPPDQVDVRLHGSAANFFSSARKTMPTEQDLAGNQEALARLRDWFGDDPNRPVRRPFDAMYRPGLDPKPSRREHLQHCHGRPSPGLVGGERQARRAHTSGGPWVPQQAGHYTGVPEAD